MAKDTIRVVISGAAGQIGYSLIPMISSGKVFGVDQPLELVLFDIPRAEKILTGVGMEVDDCAYPLVKKLILTTKTEEAFVGVHIAVLVGGFPRGPGMERSELLEKNAPIFVSAGKAINDFADPNVKVLVVANPANTNCWMAAMNAPKISKKNFGALTRLDENRAQNQIALKVGVDSTKVKNVIIWGNHSATQYPDVSHAVIEDGKEAPVTEAVKDDEWLKGEFIKTVQQRGAAIIKARGLSSAMSAANAAADCLHDWWNGTAPGKYCSMAVWSDGSYGIEKEIMYSFPLVCKNGDYEIVKDLDINEYSKGMMKKTEEELIGERKDAKKFI